ncbi:MAG TPA: tRNA preQ1(34) S-adenosylmethionine ribosyltransferase-isomerase QueA [Thermoanaerobaculia bacterium]|jgi:S-adenosylmethionine:tRNA ribosyltransferase-isomerase|nr:tRNA preQ1(34) S-adenosylmethionine ribosyltransferase-isomerase QueA [Thermoanaerobaculia bacterium]
MLRTDFAYDLPSNLIAQEPRERGRSRMMVVSPREDSEPRIEHDSFANFPERLTAGDVLVINDTRVIPARLFAKPKAGMSRPIEILLTRRLTEAQTGVSVPHQAAQLSKSGPKEHGAESDVAPALLSVREIWEAWCKPAKRVKVGDELIFSDALRARVLAKNEGTVTIEFESDNDIDAEIERIGIPPLPPYIARETPRDNDRSAYQTVYAAERGAIAAPTAGLHFTPEILERIAARGIEIVRITLHVGIGTFKPVKVDDIAEHVMDEERYEISDEAASRLNAVLDDHRTIVAVGTTSVRTLESAIRAGDGRFVAGRAATAIFITPGFDFRAVDKLLTNFHLPESTLLMLVSAFAGIETIRRAYAEAIGNQYFFYSYGDCMLLNGRGSW